MIQNYSILNINKSAETVLLHITSKLNKINQMLIFLIHILP